MRIAARLCRGRWRQKERVLFNSEWAERRKVLLWEQNSSYLGAIAGKLCQYVPCCVRFLQWLRNLRRLEVFEISQTGVFTTIGTTSIGHRRSTVSTVFSFAAKFFVFEYFSSEKRNDGCLLHRFAKSRFAAHSKMRQASVFERKFSRWKSAKFAFEMLRANWSSQQRVMLLWRTVSKCYESVSYTHLTLPTKA